MKGVELKKMIQELKLYNKTPDIDISTKRDQYAGDQPSGPAAYRVSGAFCKRDGYRSSVMWNILIFCTWTGRRN